MSEAINPADTQRTMVLVLDIPFGTTAEETTERLDEPYRNGFYIHRAIEWPGGVRVLYVANKTSAKPKAEKTEATGALAPIPTPAQTRESAAMAFLRDNRQLSATALAAAFKALGFPRSPAWISKTRAELTRVDRRALG